MRVTVETHGGQTIRVNDRDGRGVSLNQGASSIRILNRDIVHLVDAIISIATANRGGISGEPAPGERESLAPEYRSGRRAYMERHPDGGLTIGKGESRIMLDADETAQLIAVAGELAQ